MTRREFATAAVGGLALSAVAETKPPATNLGLLIYSYGRRAKVEAGFADPARFLAFARDHGANAIQVSLGVRSPTEAAAVRKVCDQLGMAVEGIVSPPKDEKADLDRFAAELATARACGADVVRVVMLGGRRYEVFTKPDDYPAFAARSESSLKRAEPVAQKTKVILAVENHKDYRTDEQMDVLTRLGSEWVGICVDTGNNLALLEDPQAAVEALAPLARSVHLKDIGLEPSPDGFRMAEVPLGRGVFDLPKMVSALRGKNPRVRFHLEMITRDPLSIPCLGEKYWATLGRVPGRDLARTLARVGTAPKGPLPRIDALPANEQLAAEDRHVRESFAFADRTRLLAT